MVRRPPFGFGPQPSYVTRRNRDPHGLIRMALVFVGAAIGAFVVWPMIRTAFTSPPTYVEQAQPYREVLPGRRPHDR